MEIRLSDEEMKAFNSMTLEQLEEWMQFKNVGLIVEDGRITGYWME